MGGDIACRNKADEDVAGLVITGGDLASVC